MLIILTIFRTLLWRFIFSLHQWYTLAWNACTYLRFRCTIHHSTFQRRNCLSNSNARICHLVEHRSLALYQYEQHINHSQYVCVHVFSAHLLVEPSLSSLFLLTSCSPRIHSRGVDMLSVAAICSMTALAFCYISSSDGSTAKYCSS